MKITLIGLDLAQSSIQVCLRDERGQITKNRGMSPAKAKELLANTPPSIVAMEACGSAHWWGRLAQRHGHEVRLLPPQHVKAFRRIHKSDGHDALAIVEAAMRPNLHPVPVKSVAQQDLGLLVQLRDHLVRERTAKANQIRGFAREYGLVFPKGIRDLIAGISRLSLDAPDYSPLTVQLLAEMTRDLVRHCQRVEEVEAMLLEQVKRHPAFERLQAIPGIGPVIAASLVAKVGQGQQFDNGRQMAAWVGLVPRQNGTGGHTQLGHITKAGDRYLRRQLIHGARTVLRWLDRQHPLLRRWLEALRTRRGHNRAIVALANKITRLAYRALRSEEAFDMRKAFAAAT